MKDPTVFPHRHARSELLLGQGSVATLAGKHVAVFGLGGVGAALVEGLARMGVGKLTLIDRDVYTESNLNRQLFATTETVGMAKTQAALARVLAIDPSLTVAVKEMFVLPENIGEIDFSAFDYVADAIDTVSAKLAIAEKAARLHVPLISAMGAGNKLDPTAFRVADISQTRICPLCRVMRTELRRRGILHVKVVYSEEEPRKSGVRDPESGKPMPGSCSFVPPVVGFIMAGEIIKDLLQK